MYIVNIFWGVFPFYLTFFRQNCIKATLNWLNIAEKNIKK